MSTLRDLFFTEDEVSCVRCHHAEGKGSDVGPKLDGIAATKPRPYLLESIVAPNSTVDKASRTTVILTGGGQVGLRAGQEHAKPRGLAK